MLEISGMQGAFGGSVSGSLGCLGRVRGLGGHLNTSDSEAQPAILVSVFTAHQKRESRAHRFPKRGSWDFPSPVQSSVLEMED